jgi:hypothetical protein
MAKIVKGVAEAVTKKKTWLDVKAGALGGVFQGFGIHVLGKTLGTLASAVATGALPTKKGFMRVSSEAKTAVIANQVNDAVTNLLVGQD